MKSLERGVLFEKGVCYCVLPRNNALIEAERERKANNNVQFEQKGRGMKQTYRTFGNPLL